LAAAACDLVGTPYRHQGNSRQGLDCIGLVRLTCESAGVPLPAGPVDYGRLPRGQLHAEVSHHCRPLERPCTGALVLLRWPGYQWAAHCAVLVAGNLLVHACTFSGRVISHGYRGQWINLTDSIWALPGVCYE
jgi:cell wall-associated NlpC family hydrolase